MYELQEVGCPKSKWRSFTWDDQILDDAIHGKIRIRYLGHIWRYKLTDRQRVRLEDAKKRGYVVCRRKLEDRALLCAWFTWCEVQQWPYVKVIEARLYATVRMDLIAMSYKMNVEMGRLLRERLEAILGLLKWRLGTNQCLAYVRKVPLADTPAVAETMLEFGLNAKEETAKNLERATLGVSREQPES